MQPGSKVEFVRMVGLVNGGTCRAATGRQMNARSASIPTKIGERWGSSRCESQERMVWWDSSRCDESGVVAARQLPPGFPNGRSAAIPTL